MIELNPEIVTIIMLGGLLVGILSGYPLAFIVGGLALIVGYLLFGMPVGQIIYTRTLSILLNYIILAAPLFIFMGEVLQTSGITERLYDALFVWLGGVRGGLALVTILVGTILAACVGIIAASISMLALVALPSMMKRGYDKRLASGAIIAGGCLGILIPPSIMLVIYGPTAQISVGKLFMGAFMPGFLLSSLYMTYIVITCLINPRLASVVPIEERGVPFTKKLRMLLFSMVPPVALVLSVLGVIFLGIAPPTEAAAVGALAAIVLTLAYRRLSWRMLRSAAIGTLRLCGFMLLIGSMSFAFVGVFIRAGCGDVIGAIVLATPGGKWGAFAIIMFMVFLLGFFLDWIGIVFIIVPIITPIVPALGFDPLWFAIMVCVNLQSSFMTPPLAPGLFIFRGSADPKFAITMADIIRGIIPFVIIIFATITLCVIFPQIITWLPAQMIE